MAPSCSNFILLWLLLIISYSYLQIVAGFPRIEHHSRRKDGSIAFLVVGDWGRGGNFNQSIVASQMGDIGKKLGIDFVISTGDNFYDNGLKGVNDPSFQRSFTNIYTAKSLQKPWYIGNHDYLGSTEAQLSHDLRKHDHRWYCKRNFIVRAGIVDIVFIDTTPFVNKYFENPKKQKFDWKDILPREKYLSAVRRVSLIHARWDPLFKTNLDLALKRSRAPWKIVVGHHTIKSIGHHGDTQEIVDQLLPVLEANEVNIYINGHDHCLEHLSNKYAHGLMHFFTSGGGSKAWKEDIHHGEHNDSTQFYYDGQGFMYVKLKREGAEIAFYDVLGEPLHYIKLRP